MSKKEYIVSKAENTPFSEERVEGQLSRAEKAERRSRRGGALLGTDEKKLDRPEYTRDGYQRRWINDVGERPYLAYQNDYDYVERDGQKLKKRVGSKQNGDDLYAFLMEKPSDWYQEDQKKKLDRDSRAQALKNKATIAKVSKDVQIYRPEGNNSALAELEE